MTSKAFGVDVASVSVACGRIEGLTVGQRRKVLKVIATFQAARMLGLFPLNPNELEVVKKWVVERTPEPWWRRLCLGFRMNRSST